MKKYKVLLIFFLILVLFLISYAKHSFHLMQTQIEELSLKFSKIENEFIDINQEIYDLYKMNSSHENCIALAIQMNEDEILAEQYERTIEEQHKLYSDDDIYNLYYGRLYVPDIKLDVALYESYKQNITDRRDSANIFTWGNYYGQNIADHNNQEFSKLFSVKVGMQGYIRLKDGYIINIECVEIFDGYNTGTDIIDESGVSVMGKTDYLMYTCRNGWRNVRVCLWNII